MKVCNEKELLRELKSEKSVFSIDFDKLKKDDSV